jgi:hypothetical protein
MIPSFDEIASIHKPRPSELYARLVLLEKPASKIERTRDTIHIFYEDGNPG